VSRSNWFGLGLAAISIAAGYGLAAIDASWWVYLLLGVALVAAVISLMGRS
jgi:hypothetical protein